MKVVKSLLIKYKRYLKDGTSIIHFAIHHLIVDTISWRILAEDLESIYYNKNLGQKTSSYRQWGAELQEYAKSHIKETEYWTNVLADYNPYNKALASNVNTQDHARVVLSQEQTKNLLQKVNAAYNTQINDILLTALGYTLLDVTGSAVNHITLEGHGREEISHSLDITRTVGWFTTMYPVRLEVYKDIGDSIKQTKQTLRIVPNKGIGYGPLLGYHLQTLPRINFNYLGRFDKKNQISDDTKIERWCITNYNTGVSIHPTNRNYNIIDINGLTIDQRMQFNISTSLKNNTASKIAEIFKQKLIDVIDNCLEKPATEYSISDFEDFEPYVTFNDSLEDNDKVFFIFPPAHGGAESYFNNIVPKLGNKKLVLFNNYLLHLQILGINTSYLTYEKLAREYIAYMKSIQSTGPYNLLGWSFGGVLAFEIMRQLSIKGDSIGSIVLIDSFFDYKEAGIINETESRENYNINYQYTPSISSKISGANIILFKALQVDDVNNMQSTAGISVNQLNSLYKLYYHYAKHTRANYLDKVMKSHKFTLIPMKHSHHSWINDESIVDTIVECLIK